MVNGEFKMAEGTRMALVMARALRQLITELKTAATAAGLDEFASEIEAWTMGVVYTPYSVFSGVDYIRDKEGFEVKMAKTGIKYVDRAARTFTFGIYFESNGHGDIAFDVSMIDQLRERFLDQNNAEFKAAFDSFLDFLGIVNDTDGDAVANVFVFLASAIKLDVTFEEVLSYYDDGCNLALAAEVKNRFDVVTTDDEITALKPEDL